MRALICVSVIAACYSVGLAATAAGWVNVQDKGVTADGHTVQTAALQALIDEASAGGGGTLYFPPGDYVSGTIVLKDNITLHLESNARILGSDKIEDYKPRGLIVANGARNIAILGHGVIDGRGQLWWVDRRDQWTQQQYENHPRRRFSWVPHHVHTHPSPAPGRMLQLRGCDNVTIRDVTLKDSESWNLHLLGCKDVNIDGIRILSDLLGPNSDGIDVEACADVRISNCVIYCGDDGICLKNETAPYDQSPCKNITVTNCIITTTCNGFKIGTGTSGDFENITFSNSVIKAGLPDEPLAKAAAATLHPDLFDNGLAPLSGIAIESVDGGHVRGVSISNIVMHGVRAPIFARLGNRGRRGSRKDMVPTAGTVQDVSISNVIAYGAQNASMIAGIPGHPVKNVSLTNILVQTDGTGTRDLAHKAMPERIRDYPEITSWGRMPVYGLYCRHVDTLTLDNIRIFANGPDERPALTFDDVTNFQLSRFDTNRSQIRSEEVMRLIDVRSSFVSSCFNMTPVKTWIRILGSATDDVHIQALFPEISSKVSIAEDVAKSTVHQTANNGG